MENDESQQDDGGIGGLEGRTIADRYKVASVVSSGANTVIVEAIDIEENCPVTVKIVRPELAVYSEFLKAFRRQAEVATALTHPNIAAVLDWGETELEGESTVFWVVEYLGGGSLRDLFDRGRLIEASQALVIGLEACRALDAAHQRGIVHTEVTPSKLVFGEDRRLRIVDFGMAALLGAQAWADPATVATHVARYASPEQALGMSVGAKCDVYALSLCLIEAVTGSVPFAGDSTVSTLAARVGKLMPVSADLGSLASVLERAGRPEAEDRWSASEFGQALVQAAETLPRPEPLPLMEASLFAVSMRDRTATAPSEVEVGPETVHPEVPKADLEPEVESEAGAASVDAAVPLILMTDIADPPTGAVQVAEDEHPPGEVPGDQVPNPTQEIPAEMVTAAAVASAMPFDAPEVVDPTPSGVLYDDEKNGKPWGKIALLALVILVCLGALSYAGWVLLRTKSFEVPDLVGVEENIALNEISGNGWIVETERARSDDVPDIDDVIRTVPAAGVNLDEGEVFVLYVSDGPELRTLPELEGLPLEEALSILTELRLNAVEGPPEFSETVPAGNIVKWSVRDDESLAAGAQVLPETTLVLTVSEGPEPRPAPALFNLTLDEATATADALQLVLARGDDVFSLDIEAGRVVLQEPPPETLVERGGVVSVQLSKGPDMVPIPDLNGLTFPESEVALTDAGYVIDSLLGTTEGLFVSISVNGQEVQPGAMFVRGTGVDLVFL